MSNGFDLAEGALTVLNALGSLALVLGTAPPSPAGRFSVPAPSGWLGFGSARKRQDSQPGRDSTGLAAASCNETRRAARDAARSPRPLCSACGGSGKESGTKRVGGFVLCRRCKGRALSRRRFRAHDGSGGSSQRLAHCSTRSAPSCLPARRTSCQEVCAWRRGRPSRGCCARRYTVVRAPLRRPPSGPTARQPPREGR